MRHSILIALVLTPALALAAPQPQHRGSQATPDWQNQIIKATGQGAPDIRRQQSPSASRIQAEKAAELDALRIILTKVRGLQLQAGKTVGQQLDSNSELDAQVQGVVRNYKITDRRYFSDGGVEVDVEVAMGDVLAELLGSDVGSKLAQAKPAAASPYSGLVVDAHSLKVAPALAPHIVDQSGQAVYGPENVSSDSVKLHGVAGYLKELGAAQKNSRVGEKPLVVKALKAMGPDLTISDADAAKIRDAGFLAEGRVIIVAD
jgi:hypothetical protein